MAKRASADEKKSVKQWQERIAAGNRLYQTWDDRYTPDVLRDYYLGKQWRGTPVDQAKDKYTINLIFPTIETSLPSLLFYRPQVRVEPRPPHADDQGSDVANRAQLLQDTLQTFVDDPKLHFKLLTYLALRDAEFAFGVIEVGYSADFIDNPNVGKPVLKDNDEPLTDAGGTVVTQPPKLLKPGSEQPYIKRIPAKSCRVSQSNRNLLLENDWFAYYEWHFVQDVKNNPKYSNTDRLKAGGTLLGASEQTGTSNDGDQPPQAGMVKLWKVFDFRAKVRHVLAEGHDQYLLQGEPMPFTPLAVLKFFEVPDEFYPLPPVYNWLGPQDEINEIREARRTHRRRFTRRYTIKTGAMDSAELEKLESGEDGVYAERKTDEDPIKPVQDAALDPGNTSVALTETKDDFMQITGVSGEQRGIADSDTATQANIINVRSQIRESQQRVQVADWLSEICRLLALTLREKMQLPFWIKANTDPFQTDPASTQRSAQAWREVKAESIQDFDFDIKIDISSLSPVTEDAQRVAWNQVLTLLTNPTLLMILMQSEPLLRKTLGFYGIKSDSEIREIARVGQIVLQAQQMQMAMAAAAKGGGAPGLPPMPGQPAGKPGGLPAVAPGVQ